MLTATRFEVDFIEELRLRRWARENYCPRTEREQDWHPIIHDEMVRKDCEAVEPDPAFTFAGRM